ncbi:hypothetical protein HB762_26630 (plasmid) [Vibrio campbellii]|uniref:Uncharacterized protein n=1 Tax=Vibrio campbellii TaxID=680 RepID=A0ABY5IL82_9VIBR|nr:hypothetical protein [Vibrio campbellii]UTZ34839.1 hypothetical protein HB762_26630 [Vibrio campbellii]
MKKNVLCDVAKSVMNLEGKNDTQPNGQYDTEQSSICPAEARGLEFSIRFAACDVEAMKRVDSTKPEDL